ncbi:3-hydroxyacyl-CoA dehydrogenase NAD-binding domain-containing protein [Thioalkalivibrio sp. XN279]|uniref:3-hydroxyacyl-CoA dehydrogenase NAD-binding domain-containing protein n=1 Tax=Thioalkalivibrio sp. XN279 TaxID=2714953 RepID=UPI0014074D7A|nr:3-hydroxyacyl-CoA dehydrogenase NAD-binding domain-containing protein [Thioalkalivibrio sp. XN279]NHA15914.1 3-hydroxyacyl-CoA dehydrogenase [Thioalkalivibrio sp. XN279]
MTETIKYSVDQDGVALLVIDIPGRPMNVLTPEFMQELEQTVGGLVADDKVKGAVITSGKDSFIAGADLKDLVGVFGRMQDPAEIYGFARSFSLLFRKLETCGKPLVAAINGTALGGGLELCLACHHRVALKNPKAKIGLPEVQVGLLPGAGGTQRLPRMIGSEKALMLMVEGTHLDPVKAHETGFIEELADSPEDMIAKARAWILEQGDPVQPWDKKGFKFPGGPGASRPGTAQTFMVGTALVAQKTQRNYPAPIAILSCVYEGSIVPIDKGLEIESQYFTELLTGPVARNMIRTLFLDKGAADKLARRPKGIDKVPVQKLGILGAGMMGAGIAYVSAFAGMDVVLLDMELASAEKGKGYSKALLEKRVSRGKMAADKAEAVLARIKPTTDYADLEGCDLIIEAVFEDRDIKRKVTEATEAVIPAGSIFASNTSTLPITGLAEASKRPDQFIGIHFFSPVDKMPLVEIIVGAKTGDVAVARALDYVQQIRKTPIVVNDSRGFYTSRVFSTYVKEGLAMLAEGVKPALIENAAKMAGMPVGPLAVSDEVTLDLQYKIMKQTRKDLGGDYREHPADAVIVKFHDELKRLGKRYGAGFYDYPEGGKKHLWPGLAEVYPPAAEQPDVEAVKRRLLYIQSLETARCLEEGVVTDPADADVGSIFGWGFPPWTGGTASYIDTVGMADFLAACDAMADDFGEHYRPSEWLRGRERMR